MTSAPQPPVFAVAADGGGDVVVFDDTEAAENYLEPIDVQNAEYRLFDALGRVLDARVDAGRTRIAPMSTEPHRDELATSLEGFARAIGRPLQTSRHDWDSFVREAAGVVAAWRP